MYTLLNYSTAATTYVAWLFAHTETVTINDISTQHSSEHPVLDQPLRGLQSELVSFHHTAHFPVLPVTPVTK